MPLPKKPKLVISRIQFGGLDAAVRRTAALRVVAITAKGPRIAFWGRRVGTTSSSGNWANTSGAIWS